MQPEGSTEEKPKVQGCRKTLDDAVATIMELHSSGIINDETKELKIRQVMDYYFTGMWPGEVKESQTDGLTRLLERKDKTKTVEGYLEYQLYDERFHKFLEAAKDPGYEKRLYDEYRAIAKGGGGGQMMAILFGLLTDLNPALEGISDRMRILHLMEILVREKRDHQLKRYNAFMLKAVGEQEREQLLSNINTLQVPLYPFDTDLLYLNRILMHDDLRPESLHGGGVVKAGNKAIYSDFFATPGSLLGGAYYAQVYSTTGEHLGVADLTEVENAYKCMMEHMQKAPCTPAQKAEISRFVTNVMKKKTAAQPYEYHAAPRGNTGRGGGGGNNYNNGHSTAAKKSYTNNSGGRGGHAAAASFPRTYRGGEAPYADDAPESNTKN